MITAIFVGGPLHGEKRAIRERRTIKVPHVEPLAYSLSPYDDLNPIDDIAIKIIQYFPVVDLSGATIYAEYGVEAQTALNRILQDFIDYNAA